MKQSLNKNVIAILLTPMSGALPSIRLLAIGNHFSRATRVIRGEVLAGKACADG
jgi:hypothetical protein